MGDGLLDIREGGRRPPALRLLCVAVDLPGLTEKFGVFVIQGVKAGRLLHVVGELVSHRGEELILPPSSSSSGSRAAKEP